MVDPAPYLTPGEIRAEVSGLDAPKYSDATLARYVRRFEGLAERYRGVAYRVRTETAITARPWGCGWWRLPHIHVSAITTATLDGVTVVPTPTRIVADRLGDLVEMSGAGGSLFTYTHGYVEPPQAILDACVEFVRAEARQQKDSQPRNATGIRDDLGWSYESTADWDNGRPTKWLAVNEFLNQVRDERPTGMGSG